MLVLRNTSRLCHLEEFSKFPLSRMKKQMEKIHDTGKALMLVIVKIVLLESVDSFLCWL